MTPQSPRDALRPLTKKCYISLTAHAWPTLGRRLAIAGPRPSYTNPHTTTAVQLSHGLNGSAQAQLALLALIPPVLTPLLSRSSTVVQLYRRTCICCYSMLPPTPDILPHCSLHVRICSMHRMCCGHGTGWPAPDTMVHEPCPTPEMPFALVTSHGTVHR